MNWESSRGLGRVLEGRLGIPAEGNIGSCAYLLLQLRCVHMLADELITGVGEEIAGPG